MEETKERSPSWITGIVLLIFFLVVAAGAWYSGTLLLHDKKIELVDGLKEYQAHILKAESEIMSTQLVTQVLRARELAKARIFRGAIVNIVSMKEEKKAQAQKDFKDFIKLAGFRAGHIFTVDGLLQATTMDKLDTEESAYYGPVREVFKTRIPYFSSLYIHKGELVSDLFIPVYSANVLSDSDMPGNILALVVPVHSLIRSFLATTEGLEANTTVRLVQEAVDGTFEEIKVDYPDTIKTIPIEATLTGVSEVEFGNRTDLNGAKKVYSTAVSMPSVRWWLATESGTEAIDSPLFQYRDKLMISLILGVGLAFLLSTTILFFFSRLRHRKNEMELADAIKLLRKKLHISKRLNETLPTPYCLRNSQDGSLLYANRAFADMCGKPLSLISGLKIADLFNPEEAEALEHGNQMLTMSGGQTHIQEIEVYHGPKPTLFNVMSLSCANGNAAAPDTLFLFREITEERATNIQNIEMRQQIIDALVRAVEAVPFLDGHTALLRQLAVEIAETLLLSDAEVATVEAAAILSQVGKSFIPKEIMQKEGKLTPEEIAETRRYVEHTCRIIKDIEFHLPIVETIWQIQENLDGSGYPKGLKGDEVSRPARILGVANIFSALVKKRSYRKAKTASQAIEILHMETARYDETVIRALEAVIESPQGRAIMRENQIEITEE